MDGFEGRDGLMFIEQTGGMPEVEDGASEDEVELAPVLAGGWAVGVGEVGEDEEQVAATDGSIDAVSVGVAAGTVEKIDEGELSQNTHVIEGGAATGRSEEHTSELQSH